MADIESLIAPVSDENPVGEDLAYDNERQQIEQAFETNDAMDGEEAVERDWRPIVQMIEGQFSRTKDVWLPVYLCRAGARMGSLETVEKGAYALAALFDQYWDTIHPQLEELGLPGRKAPCDSLAARGEFLLPLERVALVSHPRLGSFNGQDIERFRSEQEAAEGYGMFRTIIAEVGDEALNGALERLGSIEDSLRVADRIFTAAAAGEPSTNFSPTYATLATLKQALSSFLTTTSDSDDVSENEDGGGDASGAATGSGGQRLSGKVQSREDVIKALDAINDYYRRIEPSHPLQQLTLRAKHWVAMDFLELMNEIAPDATHVATQMLNKREE